MFIETLTKSIAAGVDLINHGPFLMSIKIGRDVKSEIDDANIIMYAGPVDT